jgi:micrococcal nuclease
MDYPWMKTSNMRRKFGYHPLFPIPYSLFPCLSLLAGCQPPPPKYPAIEISRVISGQSVEWLDRSQQPPVIQQGRLAGIDAPDLRQAPWGEQAKTRLAELTRKSDRATLSVEFDTTEPDKFGRKFIYLWQDGRLLNEQLVKDGYVLASMRNSSSVSSPGNSIKYRERLLRSSQYARLTGQGIWNPDRPMRMSPAEFRQEEQ